MSVMGTLTTLPQTKQSALPCHLVRLHRPLCTIKCFLRKLLNIGLPGDIIEDGIVGGIFGFGLVIEVIC